MANESPASVLVDQSGSFMAVSSGTQVLDGTTTLLTAGKDSTGSAQFIGAIEDSTGSLRLQVEADLAPGATVISVDPSAGATNISLIVRGFTENTGSTDMIVDGSSVPVIFVFNAQTGSDIELTELRMLYVVDEILTDGQSFGDGDPELTNGVKIELTSQGNIVELANLTLNEDFLIFPTRGGTVFERTGAKDIIASSYILNNITLASGSSDNVSVTVRDNLTSRNIKHFRCAVYANKVL